MTEPITQEEADRYFAQLSIEDRKQCKVDETLYGSWCIEIVDGKAKRVPPDRWPSVKSRAARERIYR